jgi:hypothetical protein
MMLTNVKNKLIAKVKKGVAHLKQPTNQDADSYRRLRMAIGILGILLPWAVWLMAALLFRQPRQPSISAFYYTGARDLFVGMLWAIGFFMLFYKGPQQIDAWVSRFAGVCAVCVTLLPTAPNHDATVLQKTIETRHLCFAAAFFVLITIMVLCLFTKADKTKNRCRFLVYVLCGTTMALCIIVMGVQAWAFPESKVAWMAHGITFVLETISIEAFGIAWLVKGAGHCCPKQPELRARAAVMR